MMMTVTDTVREEEGLKRVQIEKSSIRTLSILRDLDMSKRPQDTVDNTDCHS